MNGETIFKALSDVGDDLLVLAETKRFKNPWKKWLQTAAVVALVLCLGTVLLPYFPMGCGAGEAPMEPPVQETAPEDCEAAVEEESLPETVPEGEPEAPAETEGQPAAGPVILWYEGQAYEVQPQAETQPVQLGEKLGEPDALEGIRPREAEVYASPYPDEVYLKTENGCYRAKKSE